MSVKTMAKVWDMELSPGDKLVLLAYADHADHDDTNMYPSVETVARKTGYSERHVQRITRDLEKKGFLVNDGKGIHGTNRWSLGRGDILSVVTSTTKGVTSTTSGGDTGVTRTILEPSLEPSKVPQKKGDYLDLLMAMQKDPANEQALLIAGMYDKMDASFKSYFARNKNNDVVVKFILQREALGENLERFVQWVNRDEFNASRIWEYAENPIKIKTRWQVAMSDTGEEYKGAVEGV